MKHPLSSFYFKGLVRLENCYKKELKNQKSEIPQINYINTVSNFGTTPSEFIL
jgi:hypothetical protein